MVLNQINLKSAADMSNRIAAKLEEQKILIKNLNCSLAIAELWPGVFDKGKVSAVLKGDTFTTKQRADCKLVIIVRDDTGAEIDRQEFDFIDCPKPLFEKHIAALSPEEIRQFTLDRAKLEAKGAA